jgi:hypothetical protein
LRLKGKMSWLCLHLGPTTDVMLSMLSRIKTKVDPARPVCQYVKRTKDAAHESVQQLRVSDSTPWLPRWEPELALDANSAIVLILTLHL